MATFQDFSLLDRKVRIALEENEWPNIGYAFGHAFLQELFKDVDDVEELITDGPKDLGIDALSIDTEANIVHFFQFKYKIEYESTRTDKVRQSDLDKLHTRISQILNKDTSILEYANAEIEKTLVNLWQLMEINHFSIKIHFVTNLEMPIGHDLKKTYDKTFSQFGAEIIYYNLDEIIKLILDKNVIQKTRHVQFSGKSYFQKQDGDIRCLTGSVNAFKFIESISEEGVLSEEIFDENVRMYLTQKGDINSSIRSTALSSENYKFFYFNNGITVICDGVKYTPGSDSPIVDIDGIQIVNGSQTIHSLYEIYKDPNLKEKLQEVYLLVRVYEVKGNRELGQEIAKFTNSQNPVKGRDVRSNELVQIKLQNQLGTAGYYYARKKNEFSDDRSVDKTRILDAERVGQLILSFHLEKPGDAKNKKTEIYGKNYPAIFDEDKLTPDYILLPHLLFKEIEIRITPLKKEKRALVKAQKNKELLEFLNDKDYLLHGTYYLLFTVNVLARSKKIKIDISNLKEIKGLIPEAETILGEMVRKHQVKNELPATLFKANALVREIKEKLEL